MIRTHSACRKFVIVVASTATALAFSPFVTGCEHGPEPAGTTVSASSTASPSSTTATTALSTTSSSTGSTAGASTAEMFSSLAQASQPTIIFAPTLLPEGATPAEAWLPVVDSQDPASYEGPAAANPQVVGAGTNAESQVIFQAGDGWLAILENFRGDLGDVAGIPVGSVSGNPATLYEINGGDLVQWSQDGLWYGVFGRGVERDDVIAVALGMQPVPVKAR